MIDLKAARAEPDTWRAALARKGAGEAFDELLAADERWRALVPRVRRPAQPDEAQGQADARAARRAAAARRRSSAWPRRSYRRKRPGTGRSPTCPTRRTTPLPTAIPRTTPSRSAGFGEPPRLAEPKEASEVGRFEADKRPACRDLASAISWAIPPCSRSRSTASRSITSRPQASRASSRRPPTGSRRRR